LFLQNANSYRETKKSSINNNAIHAYLSKHRKVFKTFGLIILNLLIITYIIIAGVYWKDKRELICFNRY